jgi:hypothetical protein
MSGGMSGGPTVNLEGEVVGINSSRYVGEPISYAVPVDRIKELMADKGVVSDVSETTDDYRSGIRAFFAGDKEQAVELLTTVADEQPGNKLAADYLQQAQDLPEPAEPTAAPSQTGSSATVPILGGVGGLIILLTGVFGVVALRSRRNRSPETPQGSTTPPVGAPLGAPPAWTPATMAGAASSTAHTAQATPTMTDHNSPVGFTSAADTASLVMATPATYCSRCGSGAGRSSTFCSTCGSPLQP